MGFESSPEPEPEFHDMKMWGDTWQHLWQAHIYVFPTLFLVNAFYSINSIVGLTVDKQRMQKRTIFLFTNAMLLCFTLVTSLMMYIDPYGSNYYHDYRGSKTDFKLHGLEFLFYGMKLPCLTAAFSFVYIALMETTKFKPYSKKLHNVKYFAVIVLLHFVVSLAVHLSLVLFHKKKQEKYFQLVFICLGLFLLFSFGISFLFIFNYWKIKNLIGGHNAHLQSVHFESKPRDKNNRNTMSTELLDSHGAGYHAPMALGTPVPYSAHNASDINGSSYAGIANSACDTIEEEKVISLDVEVEVSELEFKTHIKDEGDGVDIGILNEAVEDEEYRKDWMYNKGNGSSSTSTSGPFEESYDFMLEADDFLDDDGATNHEHPRVGVTSMNHKDNGRSKNDADPSDDMNHEKKEIEEGEEYEYEDDADDDDDSSPDGSISNGDDLFNDKVFVPNQNLAFTKSISMNEDKRTLFPPLARAETESITSLAELKSINENEDKNDANSYQKDEDGNVVTNNTENEDADVMANNKEHKDAEFFTNSKENEDADIVTNNTENKDTNILTNSTENEDAHAVTNNTGNEDADVVTNNTEREDAHLATDNKENKDTDVVTNNTENKDAHIIINNAKNEDADIVTNNRGNEDTDFITNNRGNEDTDFITNNRDDEDTDDSPSNYLHSNDIAVDVYLETTNVVDCNDGISCRGFMREMYDTNSSVIVQTTEISTETPVKLRKHITPTDTMTTETARRLSRDRTMNKSVPAFVDKSLKKLLKLTTAVTVSSFIYCVGIIYYIWDVSKHYHWCKNDKKWMMEVDHSSWLIYQTVSRVAELGMTATMSYLVRRSGFSFCRDRYNKRSL